MSNKENTLSFCWEGEKQNLEPVNSPLLDDDVVEELKEKANHCERAVKQVNEPQGLLMKMNLTARYKYSQPFR
jgi:hypothetical protein